MILCRWWRRGAAGRARRVFLAVAVAVAVALAVALVPRGVSAAVPAPAATPAVAPNDGGVSWVPVGAPAQEDNGGDCEVAMSGTVSGPGAPVLAQVGSVLQDEAPDSVNLDGIGDLSLSVPQGASGTSMTVFADAGVDCSAVNQADAYIREAPRGAARHAVLLGYDLPTWLKVAIAAVAAAVLFAAVSVAVTAALTALFIATGVTVAPAVLAFATGCVAGAVAGPVATAIATSGNLTVVSGLASALAGCFAGISVSAALGLRWIASVFHSLGWTSGTAVIDIAGQELAANAAASGVGLGPIETELVALVTDAGVAP